MHLSDLFIIYLACGAPFAVYYLIKNRPRDDWRVWLKSLLCFLFWIPFAIQLLRQRLNLETYFGNFGKQSAMIGERTKNFTSLEKRIERILFESDVKISVYEFREVFERYVGLSLAENLDEKKAVVHEKEIFRVALRKNVELGAICLHRRNRKRLEVHQIAASRDFLNLIEQMRASNLDSSELENLAVGVCELAGDSATKNKLEEMFNRSLQTEERPLVKNLEKDLWKPETHKLSTAQLISRPQTLKATLNLHKKD